MYDELRAFDLVTTSYVFRHHKMNTPVMDSHSTLTNYEMLCKRYGASRVDCRIRELHLTKLQRLNMFHDKLWFGTFYTKGWQVDDLRRVIALYNEPYKDTDARSYRLLMPDGGYDSFRMHLPIVINYEVNPLGIIPWYKFALHKGYIKVRACKMRRQRDERHNKASQVVECLSNKLSTDCVNHILSFVLYSCELQG